MNLVEAFSSFNQHRAVADIWQMRRQQAIDAIQAGGWPTRKQETWKYTSTQGLKALTLHQAPGSDSRSFQIPKESHLLPDFHHLVFVDGVLISNLSKFSSQDLRNQETQLQVQDLREALVAKSGPWTKWMGRWEAELSKLKKTKDFTEQISEAFLDSGVCIQIPSNTKLEKPLQIAFLTSGKTDSNFSSTQVWIDIGSGSVVDLAVTSQGNALQVNQTQIWAHENSKTTLVNFNDLKEGNSDLQRTEVQLEAGAELQSWAVGLGGQLQRNELEIYVKGSQATAKAWGVSMTSGTQVIDHHTLIDHVKGGSQTEQLYKGVLSGESRIVFDGQVRIRQGADKASSEQLNKNLILSGSAEVDSKPQLQVLADDVKATHGSATGQISKEELFYFQSRGISKFESRRLLAMGFVDDLVDRHPLKSVREMVKARLKLAFEKSWETVRI